jgi:hypothetical protein
MKTIYLFDDTQIVITDEQAEKIEAELLQGDLEYINVNSQIINPKSISRIAPSQATQADIFSDPWADESQQLETGRKCKGSRSINLAVMNEAKLWHLKTDKEMNPKGLKNFQLIGDKAWREKTKAKLLKAEPDGYCDQEHGKCVCYPAEVAA